MLAERRNIGVRAVDTSTRPAAVPDDVAVRRGTIEALHQSAPELAVFAVDAAITGGAVVVCGTTWLGALIGGGAFVGIGVAAGLYQRRTSVETQGVAWYARHLPLPLLAMASALAVSGAARTRTLVAPVVIAAAVLFFVRVLTWSIVVKARRRHVGLQPAILVGPSTWTSQVARRIEAFPDAGVRVVATCGPADTNGSRSQARRLLKSGAVHYVFMAAESHDDAVVRDCIEWGEGSTVEFGIVLPVGAATATMARIGDLAIVPVGRTQSELRLLWVKRLMDVVAAGGLLLLLAPILAIVSAAIYVYDRGPVIYRQTRVGLDNREFRIFKFRSMVPGADRLNANYANANMASGLLFKLPDDPRVTPVGNLIRRLSIDELPQLLNVLRGDMSLVGPRPLPVDPDDFDVVASQRHRVRPGITGPWQVAGGHVLGYDDMIKLDLAYVRTWSLRRDIWLLLMTVPAVLVRRSAY